MKTTKLTKTRVCHVCKVRQPLLTNFYKGATKPCGYDIRCKSCTKAYTRNMYQNTKKHWLQWKSAKERCNNPSNLSYGQYGERGISFHPDFNDYKTFEKYVEPLWDLAITLYPNERLCIDRIDVNKGYEPGNLRFIPMSKSNDNKQRTKRATIKGVTRTLTEWCEIYELNRMTIYGRIRRGMSVEQAIIMSLTKNNE